MMETGREWVQGGAGVHEACLSRELRGISMAPVTLLVQFDNVFVVEGFRAVDLQAGGMAGAPEAGEF